MEPSSKKESILAVDDAPNTLEVLERNLTPQGYQVFTAQSVPKAITILETTPVDLVITDQDARGQRPRPHSACSGEFQGNRGHHDHRLPNR